MAPEPTFLGIPRELRDIIYKFYVTLPDGYVYDFKSGRLKAAGATNITVLTTSNALALQSTCKQVADEMRGLALSLNTITFSTVDHSDAGERAGRFSHNLARLLNTKCRILYSARHSITDSVRDSVARKYPQFLRRLDAIKNALDDDEHPYHIRPPVVTPRCEPVAIFHDFIHYTLQCLPEGTQPKILRGVYPMFELPDEPWAISTIELFNEIERTGGYPMSKVLKVPHEPWAIPTTKTLDELAKVLEDTSLIEESSSAEDPEDFRHAHYMNGSPLRRRIFRYSAAAAAHSFLESLPSSTRSHVRSIVLNEDRKSVSFPESHCQGLVRFYLENPHLRVERRVNLWRTVFQSHDIQLLGLTSVYMTEAVANWVVEASALPSAFSLIFDGQPITEKSSEVFQKVVVREAAWAAGR